jgi:hypothetical protein
MTVFAFSKPIAIKVSNKKNTPKSEKRKSLLRDMEK